MPRGRVAGGVQREGGTEAERARTCSACVSVSLPKAAKVPQGALTQRLLCSGSSKIRVCVCVGGEGSRQLLNRSGAEKITSKPAPV